MASYMQYLTDGDAKMILALPLCTSKQCRRHFRSIQEQITRLFRYRKHLTDTEAKQIVETRMKNIKNDSQYLRSVCDSYGDVIMSRWKKKNRDKREAILLKADPDMYPKKWFIPRYAYDLILNPNREWPEWRKPIKGYLLPYVNIEELKSDPSKFLGLLFNRVSNHIFPPLRLSV